MNIFSKKFIESMNFLEEINRFRWISRRFHQIISMNSMFSNKIFVRKHRFASNFTRKLMLRSNFRVESFKFRWRNRIKCMNSMFHIDFDRWIWCSASNYRRKSMRTSIFIDNFDAKHKIHEEFWCVASIFLKDFDASHQFSWRISMHRINFLDEIWCIASIFFDKNLRHRINFYRRNLRHRINFIRENWFAHQFYRSKLMFSIEFFDRIRCFSKFKIDAHRFSTSKSIVELIWCIEFDVRSNSIALNNSSRSNSIDCIDFKIDCIDFIDRFRSIELGSIQIHQCFDLKHWSNQVRSSKSSKDFDVFRFESFDSTASISKSTASILSIDFVRSNLVRFKYTNVLTWNIDRIKFDHRNRRRISMFFDSNHSIRLHRIQSIQFNRLDLRCFSIKIDVRIDFLDEFWCAASNLSMKFVYSNRITAVKIRWHAFFTHNLLGGMHFIRQHHTHFMATN